MLNLKNPHICCGVWDYQNYGKKKRYVHGSKCMYFVAISKYDRHHQSCLTSDHLFYFNIGSNYLLPHYFHSTTTHLKILMPIWHLSTLRCLPYEIWPMLAFSRQEFNIPMVLSPQWRAVRDVGRGLSLFEPSITWVGLVNANIQTRGRVPVKKVAWSRLFLGWYDPELSDDAFEPVRC